LRERCLSEYLNTLPNCTLCEAASCFVYFPSLYRRKPIEFLETDHDHFLKSSSNFHSLSFSHPIRWYITDAVERTLLKNTGRNRHKSIRAIQGVLEALLGLCLLGYHEGSILWTDLYSFFLITSTIRFHAILISYCNAAPFEAALQRTVSSHSSCSVQRVACFLLVFTDWPTVVYILLHLASTLNM
jgi:hypothetical protein